jgi:hypothetical protein
MEASQTPTPTAVVGKAGSQPALTSEAWLVVYSGQSQHQQRSSGVPSVSGRRNEVARSADSGVYRIT